VKPGITTASASLLYVLVAVQGGATAPRLSVPRGFAADLYVAGIPGARELMVRADGTLMLDGRTPRDRFEIQPSTADRPVTVLRVAADLTAPESAANAALVVQAPRFVQLRWDASSGELGVALPPAATTGIPISPGTLALARVLARRRGADVALAPDGNLFVADSRAGAVWRVRKQSR
jgi:hypothetical protein